LSAAKATLIEALLPKITVQLAGVADIDPGRCFASPVDDVWLEIGFGAGEHLAWQASRNPRIGFLGAEVFINGIAGLLNQIQSVGLTNIRVHAEEAHLLLNRLKKQSLGRVFLLFPDPWPKRRHAGRRFVSAANLDLLARLMRQGAELRFASDDPIMIAWGLRHITAHPRFRWLAARPDDWRKRPPDWPPTRYEQKAILKGRHPVYFRFERI